MNKIIRHYINLIDGAIDQVEQVIEEKNERLQAKESAHSDLLKQYWSQGKESAVYAQYVEEYDSLHAENEGLKAKQDRVRAHLQRILQMTKTLNREFRP